MKVELTDGEVRSIGEGRWLRAYWKRVVVSFAVCVAVAVLADRMVPEDETGWGFLLHVIVVLLPIFTVSMLWLTKQVKAGKRLLAERQGEE